MDLMLKSKHLAGPWRAKTVDEFVYFCNYIRQIIDVQCKEKGPQNGSLGDPVCDICMLEIVVPNLVACCRFVK